MSGALGSLDEKRWTKIGESVLTAGIGPGENEWLSVSAAIKRSNDDRVGKGGPGRTELKKRRPAVVRLLCHKASSLMDQLHLEQTDKKCIDDPGAQKTRK